MDKPLTDDELDALERWATGDGPPIAVGPALERLISEVRRLRGAARHTLDILIAEFGAGVLIDPELMNSEPAVSMTKLHNALTGEDQ